MRAGWRERPLGQVVTLQRGYDLPAEQRSPGQVPIVSSSGISGTHTQAKARGPGVITGRYGTLGEVFYVREDFWPLNTTLFVKDFKGNDPRFVSYLLRTLKFADYSDKSSVPGVNRNHLHTEMVRLPPLPQQRAIASVLGSLDDKIDVNRRMNQTLEEITRAVFRSWFVDFDPVRNKADGKKPYGLDEETAALFTDSFEGSDVGEIPNGWRVGVLGDVAENPRRGVRPSEVEASTPYIALEHMPRHSIALSEWSTADGFESNKFVFKEGEILFGKLRPYFHKVGVAPVNGVCSTDILVVSPRTGWWFGFVLGHVSSETFVDYTNAGSIGTKMPRTSWGEMALYPVALPPDSIAKAFTDTAQAYVRRIVASIHESRTLAAVRDALLPKLLSGEIRANGFQ